MPKIKLPANVGPQISKIVESWERSVLSNFSHFFPREKGRAEWDIKTAIDKFDRAREGVFNSLSQTENEFAKSEAYYKIAKREFDEVFKKFSEHAAPVLNELIGEDIARVEKADELVLNEILKNLAKAPISSEEKEVDKILSQEGMKTALRNAKETGQSSSLLEDNLPESQERRGLYPK